LTSASQSEIQQLRTVTEHTTMVIEASHPRWVSSIRSGFCMQNVIICSKEAPIAFRVAAPNLGLEKVGDDTERTKISAAARLLSS
ncbi:MAG: hypothetical protein WBX22_30070, partial [Silvibacterium sp.]